MRWFALAMATGRIRRAGQEYVYSNGRNGSIEVGLGAAADPVAARQAAKDAFLQGGYANEVKLALQERLRAEGNQPVYDQLSKWVGQQEEYKRAGNYPDDFERDIRAVQEYMKSIVPF